MMPNPCPEITPLELRDELSTDSPPTLIDVREAFERDISVLQPDVHIPIGQFAARFSELDPDADLVIYCRTGNRSAHVTAFLVRSGFKRVRNLSTGINGWARDVDPSMPQY